MDGSYETLKLFLLIDAQGGVTVKEPPGICQRATALKPDALRGGASGAPICFWGAMVIAMLFAAANMGGSHDLLRNSGTEKPRDQGIWTPTRLGDQQSPGIETRDF